MKGLVEAVLLLLPEGGGVLKVPRGENGGNLEGVVVLNKRRRRLVVGCWMNGEAVWSVSGDVIVDVVYITIIRSKEDDDKVYKVDKKIGM